MLAEERGGGGEGREDGWGGFWTFQVKGKTKAEAWNSSQSLSAYCVTCVSQVFCICCLVSRKASP